VNNETRYGPELRSGRLDEKSQNGDDHSRILRGDRKRETFDTALLSFVQRPWKTYGEGESTSGIISGRAIGGTIEGRVGKKVRCDDQ
jgi:hypothetical protein